MTSKKNTPALFIGHGSPVNAIMKSSYTNTILELGLQLKSRINSIVCISAHWNTEGIYITGAKKLNTIYDFSGFHDELYEIKYSPKGNIDLALKIQALLSEFQPKIDDERGIDHGAWSVLVHMFPKADIPVIQLSLNLNFKTIDHYKAAALLKPLRKEGVLFIGSGNIVHSFFSFKKEIDAPTPDWAIDFDLKIKEALIQHNHDSIVRYRRVFGKSAKLSVPTEEHYLPLIYIAALQEEHEKIEFIYENFQNSGMSMRSFMIDDA